MLRTIIIRVAFVGVLILNLLMCLLRFYYDTFREVLLLLLCELLGHLILEAWKLARLARKRLI